MKDLKDFIKVKDDGSFEIDYDAYKAELTSELDRARQQASETAKSNAEKSLKDKLTKEIKEELANQAKLTAEEQLKIERDAFMAEKKAFDVERIKTIYKDAGIGDDEIVILTSLIGEDSSKNLETANNFAKARKIANEEAKKKFQEEMQLNGQNVPPGNQSSGQISYAEQKAKELSKPKETQGYVNLSNNYTDNGVNI